MKPKIGIRIIIRIAANTPENPETPGTELIEAPTPSATKRPYMKNIIAAITPKTLAAWTTGMYVISLSRVAGILGCIAWVAAAIGAPQPSQNFALGDAGVPHCAHFSPFTFFTSFLKTYRASFFNFFLWFSRKSCSSVSSSAGMLTFPLSCEALRPIVSLFKLRANTSSVSASNGNWQIGHALRAA